MRTRLLRKLVMAKLLILFIVVDEPYIIDLYIERRTMDLP